jgi:hypothetical protein
MRWSDDELAELVRFVDKDKESEYPASWEERVTLWERLFQKQRTVESLRGKYNQMKWGWKPKQAQLKADLRVSKPRRVFDKARRPEPPSSTSRGRPFLPAPGSRIRQPPLPPWSQGPAQSTSRGHSLLPASGNGIVSPLLSSARQEPRNAPPPTKAPWNPAVSSPSPSRTLPRSATPSEGTGKRQPQNDELVGLLLREYCHRPRHYPVLTRNSDLPELVDKAGPWRIIRSRLRQNASRTPSLAGYTRTPRFTCLKEELVGNRRRNGE